MSSVFIWTGTCPWMRILSDVFKDFTADGISVDITVRVSPSLHTASASIEDWQNVEWGQGIITY